jgi:PAS domain-containing protein
MARVHETRARRSQPVELILARNLVSAILLPALLVDVDGHIVYYNDAAAQIVGPRFEDVGNLLRDEWNAEFGPFGEHDQPLPSDQLPLAIALRDGHPAFGRYRIRAKDGIVAIEAGALPLIGPAGYHGAIVVFWRTDGEIRS